MSDTFDGILGALIGAPALPGAKCRGRHHLFDEADAAEPAETVAARQQQAIGLCFHCPSRQPCEDWFRTLKPSKKPFGVIAGRIRTRNERTKTNG